MAAPGSSPAASAGLTLSQRCITQPTSRVKLRRPFEPVLHGGRLHTRRILKQSCEGHPRHRCSISHRTLQLQASVLGNGAGKSHIGPGTVSLILLAGGVGKRMGASIPKQYLELLGQPIAMYSLQNLATMPEIGEVVVVCDPSYQDLFQKYYDELPVPPPLRFAKPGKERQDSVYNGFVVSDASSALVAVHDSARPLVQQDDVRRCLEDALEVGAAVLGVPVKPTIKEVDGARNVVKTLPRAVLWEVQTPQVIRPALLWEGFDVVRTQNLEVTDDVSIIEALGRPVRVTQGSYTNIKVTTPDDLSVAERFLSETKAAMPQAAAV